MIGDAASDLVVQSQHLTKGALVRLRPDLPVRACVPELHVHAYPAPHLDHGGFEDNVEGVLAGQDGERLVLPGDRLARGPSRDVDGGQPREGVDEIVGEPLRQKLLLGRSRCVVRGKDEEEAARRWLAREAGKPPKYREQRDPHERAEDEHQRGAEPAHCGCGRRIPDRIERRADLAGVMVALPGILLQTAADHAPQGEWGGSEERRGILLRDGALQLGQPARGETSREEGMLPDQHLVQRDSQGPEVTAPVRRRASQELRSHVRRRPREHAGRSVGAAQRRRRIGRDRLTHRDSKIEHLDQPRIGDADICRLQIPMNDAGIVDGLERRRDLDSMVDHGARGERVVPYGVGEGRAFHVFHDDEDPAVRFPDIEDGRDVGMLDGARDAGFAQENPASGFVRDPILMDDLERNHAAQALVLSAVHGAHATGADPVEDPIVREERTDEPGARVAAPLLREARVRRGEPFDPAKPANGIV